MLFSKETLSDYTRHKLSVIEFVFAIRKNLLMGREENAGNCKKLIKCSKTFGGHCKSLKGFNNGEHLTFLKDETKMPPY